MMCMKIANPPALSTYLPSPLMNESVKWARDVKTKNRPGPCHPLKTVASDPVDWLFRGEIVFKKYHVELFFS